MGVETLANGDKAEYASQFYQSVYTNHARFLRPSVDNLPTASISHILYSEFLIRWEFKELKVSKFPGPDELPPKLLKEFTIELSSRLSVLFQKQMRGDLLQTFRIVKGLDGCLQFSDLFEFAATTHLRGHPLKLRFQEARLDVRKFAFSVRGVTPRNAFSEDVVMSPSLERNKRNVDSFMFQNEPER
ncbi:unnamed protein product [Schistocephalus solidus]|uniref:Uncharacterized protein n=1 Tax=Schistocephalus solidus TaxID=70667 RepID=A0A183TEW7_SCHSO|nr:unnamed protein product [Schistocephalus solidus]